MSKNDNPNTLLGILELICKRFAYRDVTVHLKHWGEYDAHKFVRKFAGHKPVKYGWEARHTRASIMRACNRGGEIEYKLDVTGADEQTTVIVTVRAQDNPYIPPWHNVNSKTC